MSNTASMARYTSPFRRVPPKTSRASYLLLGFTLLIWLLLLPLIVNVAGRIDAVLRTRVEIQRAEAQVAREQARVNGLKAALAYARSESFVEYWARTQQRWSKAGEVVVVVPDEAHPTYVWWDAFLEQPDAPKPQN